MKIVKVEEWFYLNPMLYGKQDGGPYMALVALPHQMPLAEGYAIRYANDLTFVLGKPVGRV